LWFRSREEALRQAQEAVDTLNHASTRASGRRADPAAQLAAPGVLKFLAANTNARDISLSILRLRRPHSGIGFGTNLATLTIRCWRTP
jgi:hypothetical protein